MSQQTTDELSTEIGPTRLENAALLCAIDAETELRGYQVTGDPVTLVSSLSRELQGPLATLRDFVDEVQTSDSVERGYLFDLARPGVDRVVGLVQDLTALATLDARAPMLPTGPVLLADVLDAVVDELGPVAADVVSRSPWTSTTRRRRSPVTPVSSAACSAT